MSIKLPPADGVFCSYLRVAPYPNAELDFVQDIVVRRNRVA
jgi:hypothetical protein